MNPENLSRPFVVIGGGIAGLCVARELALRGARVTVVERGRIGQPDGRGAATPASVGVLTAPRSGSSPLRRLQLLSHRAYPHFVRRICEETGLDVGYSVPGSLHLHKEPPRDRTRVKLEKAYVDAGVRCGWVEGGELRDLAPYLADRFRTALRIPDEGIVDPTALLVALAASSRGLGVEILEEAGETRLHCAAAPRLDLEKGGNMTGAVFIVAAGAWSAHVVGRTESYDDFFPAGSSLPDEAEESQPPWRAGVSGAPCPGGGLVLRPIRGQALELSAGWERGPNLRFRPPGRDRDYHAIAKGGGRVWIGSTVEAAGFDARVTDGGRAELLDAAREIFPGVLGEEVIRAWAGLRPQALRRGGPFLGPLPGAVDVWVHCGHYRSGILMGPLTARLLVHEIAGDEEAIRREGFDLDALRALRVDR